MRRSCRGQASMKQIYRQIGLFSRPLPGCGGNPPAGQVVQSERCRYFRKSGLSRPSTFGSVVIPRTANP